MKRLFAALAALPLLAACNEDAPANNTDSASQPAPAITERAAEMVYDMKIADASLVAMEFTPAQDSNETCIYVSPRKTWDGSAQDCFAKAESGKMYSGISGPMTYTMPIGGATMYVLEFSPRTAPHVNCVYMSPARTWTGSTLKCTPR